MLVFRASSSEFGGKENVDIRPSSSSLSLFFIFMYRRRRSYHRKSNTPMYYTRNPVKVLTPYTNSDPFAIETKNLPIAAKYLKDNGYTIYSPGEAPPSPGPDPDPPSSDSIILSKCEVEIEGKSGEHSVTIVPFWKEQHSSGNIVVNGDTMLVVYQSYPEYFEFQTYLFAESGTHYLTSNQYYFTFNIEYPYDVLINFYDTSFIVNSIFLRIPASTTGIIADSPFSFIQFQRLFFTRSSHFFDPSS